MLRFQVILLLMLFSSAAAADFSAAEALSKTEEAVGLELSVTSGTPQVVKLTDLPIEIIDTCIGSLCGKEEVAALQATSRGVHKVFSPIYMAMKSVRRHHTRIMAGLFFDEIKSVKDLDIVLFPIRGMTPGRLLAHLGVQNKLDAKEVAQKISNFAEKAPTVGIANLEDVKDGNFVMVQYKDLKLNKQKLTDVIKVFPNICLQVVVDPSKKEESAGAIVWDNDCLPAGVKHLELVHVGGRAKKLPDNALSHVRRLESLILPDSVEQVGDSVCLLCTELKSFKAKGLQLLGEFAFEGVELEKILSNDFTLVDGKIAKKKK